MNLKDLAAFSKHYLYAFPKLASGNKCPPHIKLISDNIQEAINKDSIKDKMLIISIGPRHGKTELISKHFPAWYLGNNPKKRVILTSYSSELSDDNSGAARDIFATWGPILWNVHPNKNIFSKSKWNTQYGGGVISAGIGGSLTGFGADCLDGNTVIDTNHGKVKISDLSVNDNVLSYDGSLRYNKVLAVKKSITKEIYEITIDGNIIRSTGNHKFFISNKGYIKAKNLQEGYEVITIEQNLCKMRQIKRWSRNVLPRLLYGIKKIGNSSKMRFLRENILEKILCCKKSSGEGLQEYILFHGMFSKRLSNQVWEKVCDLQRTCSQKDNEILFNQLSQISKRQFKYIKDMPIVSSNVFYKDEEKDILFKEMCRYISFNEYDGLRKFKLQTRGMLSNIFFKDKKRHIGQGQLFLRCMRKFRKAISSSYKSRQVRQFVRKFSNALLFMSCDNTQIKKSCISRIRKISVPSQLMYDIQVENDNNFFANNVLVHNCLIIDDYCKGAEEAESKTSNEKTWEWWQAVASTRLHPNSTTIILSTRWVSNDLIGRLLKQKQIEGEYFPFDLTYINLPALCEEDGDPLGREPGDALWPWRYSRERLLNIQKKSGAYWWAALFQGNPVVRGGNLFKSEWFRYYEKDASGDWLCYRTDEPQPLRISRSDLRISVIVDPALEIKRKNDPSCMHAWGYSRKHRVWLLIDRLNKKIPHQLLHNTILSFAHKNNAYQILVENEKLGKIIVKQAQGNDEMCGVKIPFREVATNQKDKYTRATPMASYYENQRVFHPKGIPWIAACEDNLCKFPSGDHDEDADCAAHASTLEKGMSIAEALDKRHGK